ncbi:hypothetical protein MTO96_005961 [Rhipicephalus appendiculatus]
MRRSVKCVLVWIIGILQGNIRSSSQEERYSVNTESCGLSVPEGRIIHGKVTSKSHAPWIVLVLRMVGHAEAYCCGGSIITRNVVLTAAHCAQRKGGQLVRELAVYYNTSDFYSGPCMNVKEGMIHSQFVDAFHGYDIALLKLSRPLPRFDRFVRPVCLPKRGAPTKAGPMFLAGYGTTDTENTFTDMLRYYTPEVLSDEDCDQGLQLQKLNTLSSGLVICSRSKFELTWNGDSGSPVTAVMPNGRSTQYGIHSIGGPNTDLPVPTIHTRVATFVPWIKESLRHIHDWPIIVTEGPGNEAPLCRTM